MFPWALPGLAPGEALGQQREEGGRTCERVPSSTHSGPRGHTLGFCSVSHGPGLHAQLGSANNCRELDSLSPPTPVKAYRGPEPASDLGDRAMVTREHGL